MAPKKPTLEPVPPRDAARAFLRVGAVEAPGGTAEHPEAPQGPAGRLGAPEDASAHPEASRGAPRHPEAPAGKGLIARKSGEVTRKINIGFTRRTGEALEAVCKRRGWKMNVFVDEVVWKRLVELGEVDDERGRGT